MDHPAMSSAAMSFPLSPARSTLTSAPPSGAGSGAPRAVPEAPAPCPVAETMRRIHAELRGGAVPSFDALLAFGVPSTR